MRILSVRQLGPITLKEGGFTYPLGPCTKLVLDKKSRTKNKQHELLYQQGPYYGTVGDRCAYLNNDDLFALEAKGMISIKKTKI